MINRFFFAVARIKDADLDTVKKGIEQLISKENAGEVLTESEREALNTYKSEVGAFANQRLLGNKAFVKKLITTEPSAAEMLIGKIREMREDLKVRKDPAAKAQLDFTRKAEKLFMQALSEAGSVIDATGKIHLANQEEDENTAENLDENRKVRYNRNVPQGNDFVTQAMIWARSDGTEIGEQKTLTNGERTVVIEKNKDGYFVVEQVHNRYVNKLRDLKERVRSNNERLYGTLYSSIDAYELVRYQRGLHSGENVGQRGDDGSNGGVHQSQSRSDGNTTAQRSTKNSSKVKPVHYHFNEDGSTKITYSDGSTKTEPPKAKRSRNASETVTLSKGQIAALRANYEGDKVFTKKDVATAVKTIDALQKLPAATRNELVTHLWRGYNERLNEQGFDMFTEIMWHKIHAEILQETGFEMTEDEIRAPKNHPQAKKGILPPAFLFTRTFI